MQRTILIDGNFYMQRCFMALANSKEVAPEQDFMFHKKPVESDMQFKARYSKQLKAYVQNLCRHMATVVNRYSFCDRIVFVRDFKSWRKDIPIQQPFEYWKGGDVATNEPQVYKGKRKKDDNVNWADVYAEFDKFTTIIEEQFNVPVLQVEGAEGDDWLWFAPRYLKKKLSYDTLTYCNDGDINQTLEDYIVIARQVKTKVAPMGELVTTKKLFEAFDQTQKATIFNVDPIRSNHMNEMFKEVKIGSVQHLIGNPATALLAKVMEGDEKDNIPPIAKYTTAKPDAKVIQWKRPNKTTYTKYLEGRGITLEPDAVGSLRPLSLDDLYDLDMIKDYLQNCYGVALTKATGHNLDIDEAMKMYSQNLTLLHLSGKQIPKNIVDSMLEAFDEKVEKFNTTKMPELKSSAKIILAVQGDSDGNDFFQQFDIPKAEYKPTEGTKVEDDMFALLGLD